MATYAVRFAGDTDTYKHLAVEQDEAAPHVVVVAAVDGRGRKEVKLDKTRVEHHIAELQEALTKM